MARCHIGYVMIAFLMALSVIPMTAFARWQGIISIGTGAADSTGTNQPITFPINDPTMDEFYIYSADHKQRLAHIIDGFFGIEWYMQRPLALQLGINYSQTKSFFASNLITQGADVGSEDAYTYHYDIATQQLLFQSKLLFTAKKGYYPYVLAGIGIASNTAYHFSTNAPFTETFSRQYSNGISRSFSYTVGAGLDVDITQHWRIGGGYRFTNFGRLSLGNATIDGTSVAGTLQQPHLYAYEIVAQLTAVI